MAKKADQLIHLKRDRKLKSVIEQVGAIRVRKDADLYAALMRAIVGQQLSVKAAATIWERFRGLFEAGYPHAGALLEMSDETLRSVGLSYQKAGYIRNIARFSIEKTLEYKQLRQMPDEDLIQYLVEIKGVGRWTVEMILMFNLGRFDVFPKDDLGIQNGMIRLYGLQPSGKRDLFLQMERIAESWRPYRSLACMYIWRYKDGGW